MSPTERPNDTNSDKKLFDYRADPSTSYDLTIYLKTLEAEFAAMREKRANDPYSPDNPTLPRYFPEEEQRMMRLEKNFLDLPLRVPPSAIPKDFSSEKKITTLIEHEVPLRILPRVVGNPFANTRRVGYTGTPGYDVADKYFEMEERRGLDAPFAYSVDALIDNGLERPEWVTLGMCGFRIIPGMSGQEEVIQVDHLTGPDEFLRVDDPLKIKQTFTPGWAVGLWIAVQYARSCHMKKILIRKPDASYWKKVRENPEGSPYGQIVTQSYSSVRKAVGLTHVADDLHYAKYNVFLLD